MREMASLGINPGVVCYTTLLNAYGTAGDVAAAQQVLTDMIAVGVKPNSITYTSLMGYYSQLGDVAKIQASHAVQLYMLFVLAASVGGHICIPGLSHIRSHSSKRCAMSTGCACSLYLQLQHCNLIFSSVLSSAFLVSHVLCPARSCCTTTDRVYASAHVGTSISM